MEILAAAAKALGLEIKSSDAFARDGEISGVGSAKQFLAAFNQPVGKVAPPIESWNELARLPRHRPSAAERRKILPNSRKTSSSNFWTKSAIWRSELSRSARSAAEERRQGRLQQRGCAAVDAPVVEAGVNSAGWKRPNQLIISRAASLRPCRSARHSGKDYICKRPVLCLAAPSPLCRWTPTGP